MDAGEIAQNRDTRNIFAVEREYTGRLRSQVGGAVGGRDMAMDVFMVHVVCRCDLSEEPGDHLNNVCDRHRADLVLSLLRTRPRALRSQRRQVFTGQAVDMRQALDADAAR